MLDDDQYGEQQYLVEQEESSPHTAEQDEQELYRGDPQEVVELVPADGTHGNTGKPDIGAHPAK